MTIVKNGKLSQAFLTRSLQRELDRLAKGLRSNYKFDEKFRRNFPPVNLAEIQERITALEEAEYILKLSAQRAGLTKRYEKRGHGKTALWMQTDLGRHPRPPSFLMRRRNMAASVCKAEVRRLTYDLKRYSKWLPRKGRPAEPQWGYMADCLANFLKRETKSPNWDLVGETLAKHFPEAYAPPADSNRGLWAYTLAKRFRQLIKTDPLRYMRLVGLPRVTKG